MKSLILAEKPDVARNIAIALECSNKNRGFIEGDRYVITWAVGHLLELCDVRDYKPELKSWSMDNFPFIPRKFKYKVKDAKGIKNQLNIIKKLSDRVDIDSIIVATDDDREGQLIGDTIINYLNIKKKVYRLLRNEWTSEDVKKGFENIIPNREMKFLGDSAVCRQITDWLLGINLTSVATLKYVDGKGVLNVGRVLMPTLKLVYDRDMAIKKFIPKKYFKLIGHFVTAFSGDKSGDIFTGIYRRDNKDKFKNRDDIPGDNFFKDRNGKNKYGYVLEKSVELRKENPPHLFNLTSLQGYISSKFSGWTGTKVLEIAQKIYEKSYITYPRTESIYLEESLKGKAKKVVAVLQKSYDIKFKFNDSKQIFNSSKVAGHSALMPTYIVPKDLTEDERVVYNSIKNRFLIQFMEPAEYEETKADICVEGIEGVFHVSGKVEKNKGWKALENVKSKDVIIPALNKGEKVKIYNAEVKSDFTKPPVHHTEKSLAEFMMSCGKHIDDEAAVNGVLNGFKIGTAATRAEIIRKLKDAGYIHQKGKYLYINDIGTNMVEKFPVKTLFDLNYTGHLEKTLFDIEHGKIKKGDYLQFIYKFTATTVSMVKSGPDLILKKSEGPKSLGKCPLCGHDVVEGKKAFGCSNWKSGCRFVIWKNDKYLASMGKKVTKSIVKELLKNGRVRIKDLKSKKGTLFDAYFRLVKNEYEGAKMPLKWKMMLKK